MKFYYKGKLVRTSKTHVYEYGVFNSKDVCVACGSTLDSAEKSAKRLQKWCSGLHIERLEHE